MKNTKLVVVKSTGSIPELGGISGPIINPCELPVDVIVRLITGHRKVYEINPNNYNEEIALNLKNVKTKNFPDKVIMHKPHLAPKAPTSSNTKDVKDAKKKVAKKTAENKVAETATNDFIEKT